jgi:hypothetical protein
MRTRSRKEIFAHYKGDVTKKMFDHVDHDDMGDVAEARISREPVTTCFTLDEEVFKNLFKYSRSSCSWRSIYGEVYLQDLCFGVCVATSAKCGQGSDLFCSGSQMEKGKPILRPDTSHEDGGLILSVRPKEGFAPKLSFPNEMEALRYVRVDEENWLRLPAILYTAASQTEYEFINSRLRISLETCRHKFAYKGA